MGKKLHTRSDTSCNHQSIDGAQLAASRQFWGRWKGRSTNSRKEAGNSIIGLQSARLPKESSGSRIG